MNSHYMRVIHEVIVPVSLPKRKGEGFIKAHAIVNTSKNKIELVKRGKKRKPIDKKKVSKLALERLEDTVSEHVRGVYCDRFVNVETKTTKSSIRLNPQWVLNQQ